MSTLPFVFLPNVIDVNIFHTLHYILMQNLKVVVKYA